MLVFKLLAVAFYSLAGIFAFMGLTFQLKRDFQTAAVLGVLGVICTILHSAGVGI